MSEKDSSTSAYVSQVQVFDDLVSILLMCEGERSAGQCFQRLSYLSVRLWLDRVREVVFDRWVWEEYRYHPHGL